MDIKQRVSDFYDGLSAEITAIEKANASFQQEVDLLTESNNANLEQIQALQATIKEQEDTISKLSIPIKPKQRYGVVGHTFDSAIYRDVQKFVDNGNLLGMNCTRMSPPLNANGIMTNEADFFTRIYPPFKMSGWDLFWLLDTEGLSTTDDGTQYKKGFNVASGAVKRYGKLFEYVELGNELAIRCMTGGDGRTLSSFDAKKLASVGQYLKGCYDGIKSVDPNYKIALNCEWTHWGFIDYMRDTVGVKFDILTYHWYVGNSNQETNFASQGWNKSSKLLIEDFLSQKYPDVEIVFNECGYANKTLPFDQDKQATQLPLLVKRLRDKGYTVLIYQMYDQAEKGVLEGNYGIIDANGVPKKVFPLLK